MAARSREEAERITQSMGHQDTAQRLSSQHTHSEITVFSVFSRIKVIPIYISYLESTLHVCIYHFVNRTHSLYLHCVSHILTLQANLGVKPDLYSGNC